MGEPETEDSYGRRLGAVITEIRLARGFDTQQKLADAMGRHIVVWNGQTVPPGYVDVGERRDALSVAVGRDRYGGASTCT